MLEILFRYFI